jgi:hypothetical protein
MISCVKRGLFGLNVLFRISVKETSPAISEQFVAFQQKLHVTTEMFSQKKVLYKKNSMGRVKSEVNMLLLSPYYIASL